MIRPQFPLQRKEYTDIYLPLSNQGQIPQLELRRIDTMIPCILRMLQIILSGHKPKRPKNQYVHFNFDPQETFVT